ncbi:hypothetical protein ACMFMF_000807 [Clarireedia jacksonii]
MSVCHSTATLMMMLDNAFAIFNNLAPRLQWAEIDLPFPSDDQYFKAAKYDDLRNHSGFPISKMKIKDAFMLLFSPVDIADRGLLPLRGGNLTVLDMQMLMHGMSFLLSYLLSPISLLILTCSSLRSCMDFHLLQPISASPHNLNTISRGTIQTRLAQLESGLG